MAKRPPLSAIIGPGRPLDGESPQSGKEADEPVPATVTPTSIRAAESADDSRQQRNHERLEKDPIAQRSVRRSRKDYRQLNVLVPKDIVQAFKIKAIREERELSDIVTELLARWLELPIPSTDR
jgi:hypothetical protein